MEYSALLDELKSYRDEEYAAFHRKIVCSRNQEILGVRTPVLRRLVRKYADQWQTLLTFPDDYYDVTFLKLNAVALLPYDEFIEHVDACVACIENWAICDMFKAKCIESHRDEFLPYITKFAADEREFVQRYALVTLLGYCPQEKYLPFIFETLEGRNYSLYYVHMAGAWLLAEVLVWQYDAGLAYLKENRLSVRTHNKAIQKARESYRLTAEQKAELFSLRRKEE